MGLDLRWGAAQALPTGSVFALTTRPRTGTFLMGQRELTRGLPVLTVSPFSSEEVAIQLANDTDYVLASGVHTLNLKRGHRVACALHAGTV
jgi:aldehyde dehydrogenase family protein